MPTGGNDCTLTDACNGYCNNNATYLSPTNTIDVNGTITLWCMRSPASNGQLRQVKLKIFRINGSNYDLIGESVPFTPSAFDTTYTNTCSISVLAGDIVGIWVSNGSNGGLAQISDTNRSKYYMGEVTGNTAQADWNYIGSDYNIPVHVSTGLNDVYVNSSTGSDSNAGDSCAAGHPVQTFQKAYDLLNSGGTIHICNSGADFSGETVSLNKSFSITVDGDGNFYMPQAN